MTRCGATRLALRHVQRCPFPPHTDTMQVRYLAYSGATTVPLGVLTLKIPFIPGGQHFEATLNSLNEEELGIDVHEST